MKEQVKINKKYKFPSVNNDFIFDKNAQQFINARSNLILKKVLVQLISVLDIMKIYINLNMNQEIYQNLNMEKSTESLNQKIIKKILASKMLNNQMRNNEKFFINRDLLKLSLNELTSKIEIQDIFTYTLLTNVYMSGKENVRQVKLFTGEEFKIYIKTNEEILFYKSKRKDELVKFSFKFIRKQLINQHRQKLSISNPKLKAQTVRKHFNTHVLKDDPKVIEYFYSMEVNKKNLRHLTKAPQIIEMANEYKKLFFLQDQINYNIFQKNENIFREDVTLIDFMKKIFIVQNKNNVTLQNVLNSLYVFDSFFKF